jgi:hypothetical protein
MNLASDLDRFYAILAPLEIAIRQGQALSSYAGQRSFPERGVYFFREPGERRPTKELTSRIVRVGTHAVSAGSKSTLWHRLRAHLGTQSGSGHHRSSIFRLHVGAALLSRDRVKIASWGVGSSVPPKVRSDPVAMQEEAAHEKRVSEYIGAMSLVWIDVPDAAGANSMRAMIEKNSIALLSNNLSPLEPTSTGWLGSYSPRKEIRESHLWNLNYVDQLYDPRFLDHLQTAVARTVGQ